MNHRLTLFLIIITSFIATSCIDEIDFVYTFGLVEYSENYPEEDYNKVESYFETHKIPYGESGIYMCDANDEASADNQAKARFDMIVDNAFSIEELDALELSEGFHFTYACIRGIENGASYILIGSYSYPEK